MIVDLACSDTVSSLLVVIAVDSVAVPVVKGLYLAASSASRCLSVADFEVSDRSWAPLAVLTARNYMSRFNTSEGAEAVRSSANRC
jgi:hypothetical protein